MVFCISHQDMGTSATSQYCPAEFIAPYVPDHNFAAWCRGISPMLWRSGAAVFPVLGDVYINIPSILMVDDVAGTQVPFVVHITGRGNSLVLAYVTTQALTTMDVVAWVTNDFPFTGEVSLEYAGRRLRGNEILRISSGGLFRVILHDPFFRPPEGATSFTEDSLEETTQGTWSSADLLPAHTLPILRLPSPTALIVDRSGRIYGAQMPEDLEEPNHTLMMIQKAAHLQRGTQHQVARHTDEGEIGEFYPTSLFRAYESNYYPRARWHLEPTRGLQPPGNPNELPNQAKENSKNYPCVTPFGRRIISISDLVPGPSGEDPNGSCKNPIWEDPVEPLGLPNLDAHLAFQPSTDGLQYDLDLLDKLDPTIVKRLQEQYWCLLEDWNNGQVDKIRIFTDGSFDQNTSSWAFAIVFDDGPEECILGFQAGQVEVAEGESGFLGSVTHSAQQGEIGALIWSSWWILRWLLMTGWKGPIEFCWDSTSAGGKASGLFHSYDTPGALSRHIQQALETLMEPFEVKHAHVRAHTGVVYNELVDAAAKWAINGSNIKGDAGQLQATLHALQGKLDCLWLYFLPATVMCGLTAKGPTSADTGRYDEQDVQAIIEEMMPEHEPKKQVLKTMAFELKMATYNVMTAQDHEAGEFADVGRVALLRDQFMKGEYHIVGLQETCNRSGMIVSSTHARFCSGANERGHLGVEIWFSLDLPIASDDRGHQHYFSAMDFVVLHSDPRILAVHCKNRVLECVVVCAHSPHSGTPQDIRQQWWNSLQQICVRFSSKLDHILLIDANARVHTSIDGIIGELTECFPTPNEERFIDLITASGLFLPCTFAEFQWGDIATWIHPGGGTASRLDYIAIPVHWRRSVVSTWVDWDITSGVAAIDHACSSAFLRWTQIITSRRRQTRL